MLGTREYTLCSPFRANAHDSSLLQFVFNRTLFAPIHNYTKYPVSANIKLVNKNP